MPHLPALSAQRSSRRHARLLLREASRLEARRRQLRSSTRIDSVEADGARSAHVVGGPRTLEFGRPIELRAHSPPPPLPCSPFRCCQCYYCCFCSGLSLARRLCAPRTDGRLARADRTRVSAPAVVVVVVASQHITHTPRPSNLTLKTTPRRDGAANLSIPSQLCRSRCPRRPRARLRDPPSHRTAVCMDSIACASKRHFSAGLAQNTRLPTARGPDQC